MAPQTPRREHNVTSKKNRKNYIKISPTAPVLFVPLVLLVAPGCMYLSGFFYGSFHNTIKQSCIQCK